MHASAPDGMPDKRAGFVRRCFIHMEKTGRMVLDMKISKKEALMWFEFFAQLPED